MKNINMKKQNKVTLGLAIDLFGYDHVEAMIQSAIDRGAEDIVGYSHGGDTFVSSPDGYVYIDDFSLGTYEQRVQEAIGLFGSEVADKAKNKETGILGVDNRGDTWMIDEGIVYINMDI